MARGVPDANGNEVLSGLRGSTLKKVSGTNSAEHPLCHLAIGS